MTVAAETGPASGPLPASSMPATYFVPWSHKGSSKFTVGSGGIKDRSNLGVITAAQVLHPDFEQIQSHLDRIFHHAYFAL
jgi:hypothetical protein